MKKSQMEIMGLAIIVVLISMGILFVIQFSIQSQRSDLGTEYIESQMAANLLNSMLQMTSDCNGKAIKNLLAECSMANQIDCGNGERSCEFLNRTIFDILNKTLIKWNKQFYLRATHTENLQPGGLKFGHPCTGSKDTNKYPIQAGGSMVVVSLDICKQE